MTTLNQQFISPKYRPDIDGLRAVAVLAVVAYHAFPSRVPGGFIGVDIFFVISGYLISTIIFENLQRGTFSLHEFYLRRIKRIFPALLLVLLACYIFGWFALLADEYQQLGKHIAGGASFVSNIVLWYEAGYFDNSSETKPLLHLWSLGVEEQFYLIWPFILWTAWKNKLNLLIVTVIIAIVSMGFNIYNVTQFQVEAFYSPLTRFWELLCGSLLAWYGIHIKNLINKKIPHLNNHFYKLPNLQLDKSYQLLYSNIAANAGVLCVAYGISRISKEVNFPGFWALIPVIGAILVIAAGPNAWVNRLVLSNKFAVWVGAISFPLYLWHWPLLSLMHIIEGKTPSASARALAVLCSVALAWFTYAVVERPIRFGSPGKKIGSVLVALMLAVGTLGFVAFLLDGHESRSSIRHIVNNKNELVRMAEVDQECLSYVGIGTPLFPYCRYTNANSKETVAIIGDSHAHVAYPGISEYLQQIGKNTVLLANKGCPPFVGSPIGTNSYEIDACNRRIEQLLQTIESKSDIKKVFIFSRGPIYLTGVEPFSQNINAPRLSTIPLSQFSNSAQKSIERLTSAKKNVYYVSENPELNFDVRSCLDRPFKNIRLDCGVEKKSVYQRQSEYREAFSKLQSVVFIDSIPAFCPDNKCLIFNDQGVLLYADDDHLSVSGSRFQVTRLLKPYLDP